MKARGRGGCDHPILSASIAAHVLTLPCYLLFSADSSEWHTYSRDSGAALEGHPRPARSRREMGQRSSCAHSHTLQIGNRGCGRHPRVTVLQLMEDAGAWALRTNARVKTTKVAVALAVRQGLIHHLTIRRRRGGDTIDYRLYHGTLMGT